MMTLPKFAITTGLLLALAGGTALAQSTPPAPQAPQTEADDGPAEGSGFWFMRHGKGHGKGHDRDHGEHRHGEGRGERHGGRGMMMLDANADGVIGDDEAAALADRVFTRHDQDGDGNLTETEFTTMPNKRWFGWGDDAERTAKLKNMFVKLDADKNGSVNKAEAFAEAKSMLASADTDKDGKVTPWEIRLLPRPF